MPASARRWSSSPASQASGHGGHAPARPSLRRDEAAVSEVISYILVFGIVSMMLVLGMVAFSIAEEQARDGVTELRAESVAHRVAGLLVQASLVAERQEADVEVRYFADLPGDLEGRSYTIFVEPADASHPDQVRVFVPATGASVTASIFSAGAPPSFGVCASDAAGGRVNIRFGVVAGSPCLYVEASP